jgi:hypothetical protein
MLSISVSKFYRLFFAISFAVILIAAFSLWQDASLGAFRAALDHQFCSASQKHNARIQYSPTVPQVRKNVALATHFGFHHDVTFALAWTIERVMKDNGKFAVYAPYPLSWNFQDVVDELGLYHGPMNSHENLISDLLENPGDGGIDMVILATCEIECVFSFCSWTRASCSVHLVACAIGRTNC